MASKKAEKAAGGADADKQKETGLKITAKKVRLAALRGSR
jgi:hypothetical protein